MTFKKGCPSWNKGLTKEIDNRIEKYAVKIRNIPKSEEHKKKISKTLTGRYCGENNPNFGNHYTEESKEKMRKPKTEEHKKKLSKSHKGLITWNKGIPRTDEEKKNISESLIGRGSWNKGKEYIQIKGEKNGNWQGGISFEPYCYKFNEKLKEKIRIRDNRICQECGKTELENGKKLTCHHIHYDKPNCNPDLISLCISCNSKSNINRNSWEEYFMEKLHERGLC